MSQRLISRSADLSRLRDEGYDIEVRSNLLLVKDVPYVTAGREIKRGIIVDHELHLNGDITGAPGTHVVHFAGEHPCNHEGVELARIKHTSALKDHGHGVTTNHSFSSKPPAGYADYYEKMTTYVAIISSPAEAINPTVTAKTKPLILPDDDDDASVFNYIDTASGRAGINVVSKKLAGKIAIVGVGGTGSYVLDLVAKTPVAEIHIFDGDVFSQHNAFRSPGAPTIDELRAKPKKVEYLQGKYAGMHRRVFAHDAFVDHSNIDQLAEMSFVFLCLDRGGTKKMIVEVLEKAGTPFVDVGMGIYLADDKLGGILRVTTSTPQKRDHVHELHRIPFADADEGNEYGRNIQIADLNAFNAALAVIKWKKLLGFYADLEGEHFSTYTLDGNIITNEDGPENTNQP